MFKKKIMKKALEPVSKPIRKATPAKKPAPPQKFTTVEQYLSGLPEPSQKVARQLRATIIEAAPKATEIISYNMPLYKLEGMLMSFAVWKDHIGIYPLTDTMEADIPETLKYKGAKHSLKFSLSLPLPLKLITRIVKHRVKENKQTKG